MIFLKKTVTILVQRKNVCVEVCLLKSLGTFCGTQNTMSTNLRFENNDGRKFPLNNTCWGAVVFWEMSKTKDTNYFSM